MTYAYIAAHGGVQVADALRFERNQKTLRL